MRQHETFAKVSGKEIDALFFLNLKYEKLQGLKYYSHLSNNMPATDVYKENDSLLKGRNWVLMILLKPSIQLAIPRL